MKMMDSKEKRYATVLGTYSKVRIFTLSYQYSYYLRGN
jgi:hypothetical protein